MPMTTSQWFKDQTQNLNQTEVKKSTKILETIEGWLDNMTFDIDNKDDRKIALQAIQNAKLGRPAYDRQGDYASVLGATFHILSKTPNVITKRSLLAILTIGENNLDEFRNSLRTIDNLSEQTIIERSDQIKNKYQPNRTAPNEIESHSGKEEQENTQSNFRPGSR